MKYFHYIAAFCAAGLSFFPSYAQTSFAPPDTISYTEGSFNDFNALQYYDFNGDEHLDLLYFDQSILYLKYAKSDGTFSNPEAVYQPDSPAIRSINDMSNLYDINADGFMDIAIMGDNIIEVLLGSEDGFSYLTRRETGSYYGTLIWLDFDQNGEPDLLETAPNGIVKHSNWQNGVESELLVELSNSLYLLVEDINRDERYDLIVSRTESTDIYIQKSSGGFTLVHQEETDYTNAISGDINLDGYADILYRIQNEMYVLFYDNNSSLFSKSHITDGEHLINLGGPTLLDIDENGTLDLIYGNWHGAISYKKNTGGTFTAPQIIIESGEASRGVNRIVGSDVDHDGQLDLYVHSFLNQETHFLNKNLEKDTSIYNFQYATFEDMLYEDLDNDSVKDIALISEGGHCIVYWGETGGNFSQKSVFNIGIYGYLGAVYDLNEDGLKDIIISFETPNNDVNEFRVMINQGNRSFEYPSIWKYFENPSKPQITDLNNDGISEIFAFSRYGRDLVWLDPENSIYNETYETTNKVELPVDWHILQVAISDLDDNNEQDFIVSDYERSEIKIFKSNAGAFSDSTIQTRNTVVGIGAVDFNFDGRRDILATTREVSSEWLKIYLQSTSGEFELSDSIELESYHADNFELVDLNSDGQDELIVSGWDYTTSFVFERSGDTYQLASNPFYQILGQGHWIFSDLNNDGKQDILSAAMISEKIFRQINNTVVEPVITDLEVSIEDLSHNSATIHISETNNTGKLVIVSESSSISAEPSDNNYYTQNLIYGVGSQLGGGHVVYVGSEKEITVSGLDSKTDYFVHVFEYNQNQPNNTIINYTHEHVTQFFTTTSSLFLIKEIDTLTVEEDAMVSINLNEYIYNIGVNEYQLESDDQHITIAIQNSNAQLSGATDYFGEAVIHVSASNENEVLTTSFVLSISAINDPPVVELQIESIVFDLASTGAESASFELPIEAFSLADIDNDISSLSLNILEGEDYLIENNQVVISSSSPNTLQVNFTVFDGESVSEPFIAEVSVINTVTSLQADKPSILLWPNPSNDQVWINAGNLNSDDIKISILDQSGRVISKPQMIQQDQNSGGPVDVSFLPKGTYMLHILINGRMEIIKLLKY